MEAKSWGLEILAKINQTEMLSLRTQPLEGKLQYKDDEREKEIALRIITNSSQRELVEVEQEPKECYLGNATRIIFSVNPQFYDLLLRERYSGSRFYGATGKLEIEVCPNI